MERTIVVDNNGKPVNVTLVTDILIAVCSICDELYEPHLTVCAKCGSARWKYVTGKPWCFSPIGERDK